MCWQSTAHLCEREKVLAPPPQLMLITFAVPFPPNPQAVSFQSEDNHFCAGVAVTGDGRVIIIGGERETNGMQDGRHSIAVGGWVAVVRLGGQGVGARGMQHCSGGLGGGLGMPFGVIG